MKILRHILSHLFLIFFLLAIVSVFYYRTLLLPNDVVAKVDGIVTEIYPPASKFVSKRDYFWSIAGERIVSFDDLKIFEKDTEVVAVASDNKSEDVIKVETTVEPSVETTVVKKDEVEAENKTEKEEPVVAKTEEAPVNEVLVNEKTIVKPAQEVNSVEEVSVVVKDSDTSSERDLLISARNAFNQGKFVESENYYIELTQLDNDTADIFGELGNVYYSQGKWDKAGQAYFEAAVRLIQDGDFNQVAYLQRVISGLNTEQAEKLAQLMVRR